MASKRDQILDAAASVLAEVGIAAATTKAIARAAGCSEALLYRYFDDKQQLFLAVLAERMPQPAAFVEGETEPGDERAVISALVGTMFTFFRESFPMAASILTSPSLLAEHRAAIYLQGGGPAGAIRRAQAELSAAAETGAIRPGADLEAAASVLVGFAFHQAFLAVFEDRQAMDPTVLQAGVDVLLPSVHVDLGHEKHPHEKRPHEKHPHEKGFRGR